MNIISNQEFDYYSRENLANPLRVIRNVPIKLFIGQIPKVWSEQELSNFFSIFGSISEPQVIRSTQGGHKCCAFITFQSISEADAAIYALNENYFLPGSQGKLQLRWAEGEAKRLGIDGVDLTYANRLFVKNLPKNINETHLIELFCKFGTIRKVKIIKENNPMRNRAYIVMNTKEQAITAMQDLSGVFNFPEFGRPIEIYLAEELRKIYQNVNLPYPTYIVRNDKPANEQIPNFMKVMKYTNINVIIHNTNLNNTNNIPTNTLTNTVDINEVGNNEKENITYTLRITNFPIDWTQLELIDTFKDVGGLVKAKIHETDEGLEGIIIFNNKNSMEMGYRFANGRIIKDKPLKIEIIS